MFSGNANQGGGGGSHNDIKTTLRHLHTGNKDLLKIISPLDDLTLT